MNKKFFSGDSIQQALLQAARHFQVEPDEIAYREVDRRHGFLRGRRRAVIEVDLDHPVLSPGSSPRTDTEAQTVADNGAVASPVESGQSAGIAPDELPTAEMPIDKLAEIFTDDGGEATEPESEPAAEPAAPAWFQPAPEIPAVTEADTATAATGAAAPPKPEAAPPVAAPEPPKPKATPPVAAATREPDADISAAARQALDRIFELGRVDLEVKSIRQGEEKLEIELRGEDEEVLLEDRGRLLLAIQHLLPRMLRGLIGRSAPCQVDCDDFHEIRTEQLRDLAQRVASEVRNRRRSRTLEPMSPDERRIVHITLADDPAVETVSQGNGLFKRVQIRPQKMQPRGFDPFRQE